MKKRIRPESQTRRFQFAELTRARFSAILEAIGEYGSPYIICGDYRFETLEELEEEYGATPGKIKILSNDPYVLLEFDKSKEAFLHCETGNNGELLFFKLADILKESERSFPLLLASPWIRSFIVLLILFSFGFGAIYSPYSLLLSAVFIVVYTFGQYKLEEASPQINLRKN